MNCDELKNVAPRYLAGESNEDEMLEIERHLASCESCAADLALDRQIDAGLREAMLEDQPDASPVIRRVVAQMEAAQMEAAQMEAAQMEAVPWWKRLFPAAPLQLAALAAVLVVAFVAGRQIYVHQMEKSVALAATNDHYMDLEVLKRTDWAYSGDASAHFVQTNFPGNPALVRSITPAGGSLEKVRICHLNRTPYAHFVFQTAQGEVSVFVRARTPGERFYQAAALNDKSHGLEVAGFSSPAYVGAVVDHEGVPTSSYAQQAATAL